MIKKIKIIIMKTPLLQNAKKRKYPIKRVDLPIPLHTDLKIFAAENDLFIHEIVTDVVERYLISVGHEFKYHKVER